MDTGDAAGFYSSTCVFYAMLLLEYYSHQPSFKLGFLKIARFIMIVLAGISGLGVLGILTIREIEEQYYVSISSAMRLTEKGIINVHLLFLIMAVVAVIISFCEGVFRLDNGKDVKAEKNETKKKGA